MKQQYLVTVTVDVDSSSDEDERSILRKCRAAIERLTGYTTWEVESLKIPNEDESNIPRH